MASVVCTQFKVDIWTGLHLLKATAGDALKCALFTSSFTGNAATTAYAVTNEVAGTGYTAGGAAVTIIDPTSSGTTGFLDLADVSWTTASFTARFAMVYNTSRSNKSLFIIDFGSDQTVAAGTFTIQWPTADATNAILRIS